MWRAFLRTALILQVLLNTALIGVAKMYQFGELGSIDCPRGTVPVLDGDSCEEAAWIHGLGFETITDSDWCPSRRPAGCFWHSPNQRLYNNDLCEGGVAAGDDRRVCIQQPSQFAFGGESMSDCPDGYASILDDASCQEVAWIFEWSFDPRTEGENCPASLPRGCFWRFNDARLDDCRGVYGDAGNDKRVCSLQARQYVFAEALSADCPNGYVPVIDEFWCQEVASMFFWSLDTRAEGENCPASRPPGCFWRFREGRLSDCEGAYGDAVNDRRVCSLHARQYVFADDGSADCPNSYVPVLDDASCQEVASIFGWAFDPRTEGENCPASLPRGCFWRFNDARLDDCKGVYGDAGNDKRVCSLQARQYVFADAGSTDCPGATTPVLNDASCQEVAWMFGLGWTPTTNVQCPGSQPPGCFWRFRDGRLDECPGVYGDAGNTKRVCRLRTGPPTAGPTPEPTTAEPTAVPTRTPTKRPTVAPTARPTPEPTATPTKRPTAAPTAGPTPEPTTAEPTAVPTATPTKRPTAAPTASPTPEPTTAEPTAAPTARPTLEPTAPPPTPLPTTQPTPEPTVAPTEEPSAAPTGSPSPEPTAAPTTPVPTPPPPTLSPTVAPTPPTPVPTPQPTTVVQVLPRCMGNSASAAGPFLCDGGDARRALEAARFNGSWISGTASYSAATWSCHVDGHLCHVRGPDCRGAISFYDHVCASLLTLETCDQQAACDWHEPTQQIEWSCQADQVEVDIGCSGTTDRRICDSKIGCDWRLNMGSRKICAEGTYTPCRGLEECNAVSSQSQCESQIACTWHEEEPCKCPPTHFGPKCEKNVSEWQPRGGACLKGASFADPTQCNGITYGAAFPDSADVCAGNPYCQAWHRMKYGLEVVILAAIADITFDCIGALCSCFYLCTTQVIASIKSGGDDVPIGLGVFHDVLAVVLAACFLVDVISQGAVWSIISGLQGDIQDVVDSYCFSQGSGYEAVVELRDKWKEIRRNSGIMVGLAVLGVLCDFGQKFFQHFCPVSVDLPSFGVATLAFAEIAFSLYDYVVNTQELVEGVEAIENAVLGRQALERGYVCVQLHPEAVAEPSGIDQPVEQVVVIGLICFVGLVVVCSGCSCCIRYATSG